jgi:hypothetical protein
LVSGRFQCAAQSTALAYRGGRRGNAAHLAQGHEAAAGGAITCHAKKKRMERARRMPRENKHTSVARVVADAKQKNLSATRHRNATACHVTACPEQQGMSTHSLALTGTGAGALVRRFRLSPLKVFFLGAPASGAALPALALIDLIIGYYGSPLALPRQGTSSGDPRKIRNESSHEGFYLTCSNGPRALFNNVHSLQIIQRASARRIRSTDNGHFSYNPAIFQRTALHSLLCHRCCLR